jgi:hydrogenase maturation protease
MSAAGQSPEGTSAAGAPHGGIDTLDHLIEHLSALAAPSLIIVGIGNDLCGDDGAGPAVVRALAGAVPWETVDAQTVPESFLMKIVERQPAAVLLVDAVDFHASPGAVDVLEASQITAQGPSTHGPAPLAFLELLGMLHRCRTAVLAIQPKRTDPGQPLSSEVRRAVDFVTRAFKALAGGRRGGAAQGTV